MEMETAKPKRLFAATWRRLQRADPFIQAALVVVLVRIVGLFRHYLGTDLFGHPISLEPVRFLPWAIPFHIGMLLAIAVILSALARAVPRVRGGLYVFACLFFGFLVFYGQLDLEMLRGLGQHMTPGFLGQHLGPAMFTDIADGMEADLPHLLGSGAMVVAGWVGVAWVWRRRRRALETHPRVRDLWVVGLFVVGLIGWPHWYHYSTNRLRVVIPPEAIAVKSVLDADDVGEPDDVAAATAQLRLALAPRGSVTWLDDELPALREGVPAEAPASLPDIVVVVIESLRGDMMFPPAADPAGSHPNLTVLEKRGVSFPYFISNGFPSAAGFFATQCSAWPHPTKYELTDFASGRFDCFAARLKDRGYQNAFFSASNPSMDNQLPWVRRMYEVIEVPHGKTYDREMADNVVKWLSARENGDEARPLLMWVATASLHSPFAPRDPELSGPVPQAWSARYPRALRYTDQQLGRIFDALAARSRAKDTVIIVLGDHSSPLETDAVTPERSAAPCDRLLWTGALIAGPEALTGPPRVVTAPTSQVDLMPTILRMVGDDRPTSSLGRDLLHGDDSARLAVGVTHGGYRLDLQDVTVYASPNGEDRWAQPRLKKGSACSDGVELTPELQAESQRLFELVRTWSWLLEDDLVWRPERLQGGGG